MWAQYNGVTIPNVVGIFETEETGNTFLFACQFVLLGKPKQIADKLVKIHDQLLAHNGLLMYDLGDGRLRTYDPMANTGFLMRPRIKKLGGWGMKQKYLFMVRGNLPSNRIAWAGAPERYMHGYIKMEANVDLTTSEIESIRFTGNYTATPATKGMPAIGLADSPKDNAYKNYIRDSTGAEGQILAYIQAMFNTKDFDKIKSGFYHEDQYKMLDFDIIFRRRNVPNPNYSNYVLIGCNLSRVVNQERSPYTSGHAFSREKTSPSGEPLGFSIPPTFPAIYNISVQVAVLRSKVSYTGLLNEYKTSIRQFFLDIFKNSLFKGAFKVLSEAPSIDPDESTVGATFTVMTTDKTSLWSYIVDHGGRWHAGALKRKILDSKNYSKNIFLHGAQKHQSVTVSFENVGGFISESYFTAAFPKPLLTTTNMKGWWLDDASFDWGERYHEEFADGKSYQITRGSMTFMFDYIETGKIARLTSKIPDAFKGITG